MTKEHDGAICEGCEYYNRAQEFCGDPSSDHYGHKLRSMHPACDEIGI